MFYYINVQEVCDHQMRFLDVVALWQEFFHDSRIFRLSLIWLTGSRLAICMAYSWGCWVPLETILDPSQNPQTDDQIRLKNVHKTERMGHAS